jgi:hypothetical protein
MQAGFTLGRGSGKVGGRHTRTMEDEPMTLTIKIDLDNAAFEDGGADEVARILASVASRIPDPLGPTNGTLSLHDANGNHCGTAEIE